MRRPLIRKPTLYRWARATHSYLSAFAFIALIFFSATGFLLNHPDWFNKNDGSSVQQDVHLSSELIEDALSQADPGAALGRALKGVAQFSGTYANSELMEDEAMLRFSGVKGDTTVFIDLSNGMAELETKKFGTMSIIRDLHRGKDAGAVWRLLIDVAAIFVMILSLVGFFLFFTMKFRLATSLKLVGVSLLSMVSIYIFMVT